MKVKHFKHFINTHPDNILSRTYRIFMGDTNRINVQTGNKFIHKKAWIAGSTVKVIGGGNEIVFGGSIFAQNIKIFIKGNNNRIVIDDNVLLKNVELWIEDDDNAIEIGFGTHFTGKVQLSAVEGTKIKVGNNCLFSSDIYLRTSDSHSILDYDNKKRINPAADISIGNHCWFGHRTTILKGVNMSEDIIVAAGSIITRSIEESHVIIAGTPATIIKRGVTWDEQRI